MSGGAVAPMGTNRRSVAALRSVRALAVLPSLLARRPSYALASLALAVPAALIVGLPTAIVPSSVFVRMTPVRPLDWVLWLASAALAGALLATYVRGALPFGGACSPRPTGPSGANPHPADPPGEDGALQTRLSVGVVLSALAVGCPTCNKLVVLALGAGGALTLFAPLQPVFGTVSLILLAHALGTRLAVLGVTGSPDLRRMVVPAGLTRV